MQTQIESPCIRCGKTRVVAKVWQEYVGQSLVTNTITVCPDPACQKIVDEELAVRREKRELLANKRNLRPSASSAGLKHRVSSDKQIKLNREKKNIS